MKPRILLTSLILACCPALAADPVEKEKIEEKEKNTHPSVVEWANDASSEQLQECKGIGPAMAARIIAARPFKDLAAVDAVKGIGPALMAKIKEHVANNVQL